MFLHNPEDIKKALITVYQTTYQSYLNQVQAQYPDDEVEIGDFKAYIYGDATKIEEIKAWPTLAVTSGDTYAIERTQQGRVVMWNTQIYVRYFLRRANITHLAKELDRHLAATLLMFEDSPQRTLNGACSSMEFMRAESPNSILPLGASIYVKGLEVQWEVRHR